MKDDVQNKKKLVIGLAEVYGEAISQQRLQLYVQALRSLSVAQLEKAVAELIADPAVTRFPLPAQITERAVPTVAAIDAANELVSRCITAASAFGWCDPGGARDFVGETAWAALPGERGWADFCMAGDSSSQPISTARAQLRDRISGILRRDNPSGRVPIEKPKALPQVRIAIGAPKDNVTKIPLSHEARKRFLETTFETIGKKLWEDT